ncbi:uncharacterized protein LOC127531655 isoform X2 [Acanthochromis polyacanthus]|uniref:uncharacterized protein LOC127531655 isoform X1 n=1 Tax=Acanthochromis polyacanthus TaxID=80966 RepID=UPI002233E853|nr:uncharacterized protein LOC127531655 isoform X1 [Acanthochromis polyacanthus]XP_051797373.1 uncharacterized protein LOC127531655 isoform X2 [Acanthochromis polyacanthus]
MLRTLMKRHLEILALLESNGRSSDERKRLITTAMENCKDQTNLKWLRENAESDVFSELVEMFAFLKRHVDEEEKKSHDNTVDIILVAHGAIIYRMIPACYLLPLNSITDLILYSPWNCNITAEVTYGVATGKMKPQHRVFYCGTKKLFKFPAEALDMKNPLKQPKIRECCQLPDEKHQPMDLPDQWNSLKRAGGRMIPNIFIGFMTPDDGVWKTYKRLSETHGAPGRNRIVIPFIFPAEQKRSVPLSVVMLALSLVLLSSRFKATVHLAACLGYSSAGHKMDSLKDQYSCTTDNTTMKSSPDMFLLK